MARIKTKTMANYFKNNNINGWNYVKDGLKCWSKSDADFKCRVECHYNERKVNGPCYNEVSKDALDYIVELEEKLSNVQEIKHGKWFFKQHEFEPKPGIRLKEVFSTCSLCGYYCPEHDHETLYCPGCGARMDGDSE